MKLISIRLSHYVEKVRWTMDRLRVPYEEISLMPVIHFFYVPFFIGLNGAADGQSSKFSTPILITPDGMRIQKSGAIMRNINERFASEAQNLFADDAVGALDEHYTNFLGPHTRRVLYFHCLNEPGLIESLADKNVDATKARLFKIVFPVGKKLIIAGLNVNPTQTEKSLGFIRQEFAAVEKRLADGRPFLMGDGFSAADISFAALGGVLCLPTAEEGYGAFLPTVNAVPSLAKIASELRATTAGKWLLSLYRNERGKRLIPGTPALA